MSDIDSDLKNEFEGLEYEIQLSKKRLSDYSKRHFNTQRESALIYCLDRAIELSEGCVLCTKSNLLVPLHLLTRGLIESLISVCWITKSNENAQHFINEAKNELKRIARNNLRTGHAKAFDKSTREDKTQELLHSEWAKDIQPRLNMEKKAKDVGLERLYTQMYGPLSIYAHGVMMETSSNIKKDTVSALALASALLVCINLVVKNWIIDRKQTPVKDIYAITH